MFTGIYIHTYILEKRETGRDLKYHPDLLIPQMRKPRLQREICLVQVQFERSQSQDATSVLPLLVYSPIPGLFIETSIVLGALPNSFYFSQPLFEVSLSSLMG